MMRSLWAFLGILSLSLSVAIAAPMPRFHAAPEKPILIQFNGCAPGFCSPAQSGGGGGGCSQATTFLARTSGLSGTEATAYTSLICGLVTDGIITGNLSTTHCGSIIDRLYIFATNTTATANLDICGSTDTLTAVNAPTFSADHGYTGIPGTPSYLTSAFVPSTAGGNMTLNSASIGAYILNNRTTTINYAALGASDGGSDWTYFLPNDGSGTTLADINSVTFGDVEAIGTSQGQWVFSRTGSSGFTGYHNSSTTISYPSSTSTGLPNQAIYVLAIDDGGTQFDVSADQLSAAWWGAGVTSGQQTSIASRINAYMTALGINVY
jgi:hypothetical protein